MSAAVLIAVLLVNHGDMGIMATAETIPALEKIWKKRIKKIEAETASASMRTRSGIQLWIQTRRPSPTLRRRPRQHQMGKRPRRRREKWLSVR